MLIWKGFGFLTIPLYIVVHLVLAYTIIFCDIDIYLGFGSLAYMTLFVLITGLLNWKLGNRLNAPTVGLNGEIIKDNHTLFFVPMQYWSFVMALILMGVAFFHTKRWPDSLENYKGKRAAFEQHKENWLHYIRYPKLGDYYVFELDAEDWDLSAPGKQPHRNALTMTLQVVGFGEDRITLIEPEKYNRKRVYEQSDLEAMFKGAENRDVRRFVLDKQTLLQTMPRNYYLSNSFKGKMVPALHDLYYARLVEVLRF